MKLHAFKLLQSCWSAGVLPATEATFALARRRSSIDGTSLYVSLYVRRITNA